MKMRAKLRGGGSAYPYLGQGRVTKVPEALRYIYMLVNTNSILPKNYWLLGNGDILNKYDLSILPVLSSIIANSSFSISNDFFFENTFSLWFFITV